MVKNIIKDRYDEAIEYLTDNPEQIMDCWDRAWLSEHGDLFKYVSPGGRWECRINERLDSPSCGCLTQIRDSFLNHRKGALLKIASDKSGMAIDEELTKEIQLDQRIPSNPEDITVESLPVFAEWQRKLDKIYNR